MKSVRAIEQFKAMQIDNDRMHERENIACLYWGSVETSTYKGDRLQHVCY